MYDNNMHGERIKTINTVLIKNKKLKNIHGTSTVIVTFIRFFYAVLIYFETYKVQP
jgi:hypothetical protein